MAQAATEGQPAASAAPDAANAVAQEPTTVQAAVHNLMLLANVAPETRILSRTTGPR